MSKFEKRLSSFMAVCITVFVLSCLLMVLNFSFIGAFLGKNALVLTAILIALMVLSASVLVIGFVSSVAAHKVVRVKTDKGPRVRIAAKVHSMWRTDKGNVVGPDETDLEFPGYHVVLITESNKRIELDTSPEVFVHCLEGSWGYAEYQGNWLGSYVKDPELYRKHTGR